MNVPLSKLLHRNERYAVVNGIVQHFVQILKNCSFQPNLLYFHVCNGIGYQFDGIITWSRIEIITKVSSKSILTRNFKFEVFSKEDENTFSCKILKVLKCEWFSREKAVVKGEAIHRESIYKSFWKIKLYLKKFWLVDFFRQKDLKYH